MSYMYKATKFEIVLRSDVHVFPSTHANTDYQAYLKWLAEGNTPEPAR